MLTRGVIVGNKKHPDSESDDVELAFSSRAKRPPKKRKASSQLQGTKSAPIEVSEVAEGIVCIELQ